MLKLTAEQIIKKQTAAQTIKNTWDSKYRDIFEYTMPDRDGYQKAGTLGSGGIPNPDFQDRRDILFSSIGENSADEFVNTMQEILCPPYSNWIDLEAGAGFAEDDHEKINNELEKIAKIANEHKNNSAFDMAFSEFCGDLVAGTACMLVNPGDIRQPVVFKAIPIKDICIAEGRNGEVREIYRKFSMKKELIRHSWPELKGKGSLYGKTTSEKDISLIECSYFDYDSNRWYYYVVDEAEKKIIVERVGKTSAFIVLRWNKASGEPYGRGPGMKALNDIKTLNLIMNYSLRAFAFNTPPLLVQQDAMLDVDEFELTPFSLNVVPDTETSIRPLELNTDHNIEAYKVEQITMAIKRSMFGSTIPDAGPRATATEIQERIQELKKDLSSVFGRLIGEFQIPVVRRILDVLVGFKYIAERFEVDNIDGFLFKIKINTPLARQLKLGEAQSMIGAVQMLLQFDPTGAAIQTMVKIPEMSSYLLNILGVPIKFINSPEEVKAKQGQMATSAVQQAKEATMMDVEAENAKSMGKAVAKRVEKQ